VGYWHAPRGGGRYGAERGADRTHPGIDIGGPVGRPVFAVTHMRVTRVIDDPCDNAGFRGYGRSVVAQLDGPEDGPYDFVIYAHLESVDVREGDELRAGALVGTMGKTAWRTECGGEQFRTSRAHLHLEFARGRSWPKRYGMGAFDPVEWFRSRGVVGPDFAERGATFRPEDGWGSPGAEGPPQPRRGNDGGPCG